MNPYESPRTDAGAAPEVVAAPTRSVALRVSVGLGIAGFAILWATAIVLGVQAGASELGERYGMAMGLVLVLAVSMHLIGLGVMFAAPRGKRWVCVLANGLPLLLLALAIAL